MKSLFITALTAFILLGASCSKFLDNYSQNQTFIQSVADLDELLIGEGYLVAPTWTNQYLLDDDLEQNPALTNDRPFELFGVHQWQKQPAMRSDGTFNSLVGSGYTDLYRKIGALNTILFNVPLIREKGAPESQLQRISGEAHFLRAQYYLLLINTYGKPYRAGTATTDYGIPLKITPEVELKFFSRASVQQVYDQVESDLLAAEKELDGHNEQSVIRANQAAAQALLSRVYLYMEDYEKALAFADKVIQKRYRLRDINNLAAGSPFLLRESPETIFATPSNGTNTSGHVFSIMKEVALANGPDNYRVSEDLLSIYLSQDLRLQAFFKQTTEGDWLAWKAGEEQGNVFDQTVIRLPELYLNKAEALAVIGRGVEAIAVIQELRKNRFKPEDLNDISLSDEALVSFIRDERRRELCFEQHRWFDLRRYGVNSKYPYGKTIRHRSYAYNSSGRYIQGYYELKPYMQDEAAYVLPIPDGEIQFNQGAITNESRPERPLL